MWCGGPPVRAQVYGFRQDAGCARPGVFCEGVQMRRILFAILFAFLFIGCEQAVPARPRPVLLIVPVCGDCNDPATRPQIAFTLDGRVLRFAIEPNEPGAGD